jgi:hypothetical protein
MEVIGVVSSDSIVRIVVVIGVMAAIALWISV